MLRTALKLAARGLHVFPCAPSSKKPACAHGFNDATVDSVAIQAWWRACPDYNIGIATGAVSGIFVVDVDTDDEKGDGEVELRKLEAQHGELPPTVEVITADGRHLYFKFPPVVVDSSVNRFAPGVHVRGDGGYVVAPPSIHPSGRRYCWSVDSASVIAEAPAWLIELVAAPAKGKGSATPPSEWRALVAEGVDEGSRNTQLTRLTGHLLRRYVDPFVALQLVQSWNATHCRPPLPDKDVLRIANSISGRELLRRGGE